MREQMKMLHLMFRELVVMSLWLKPSLLGFELGLPSFQSICSAPGPGESGEATNTRACVRLLGSGKSFHWVTFQDFTSYRTGKKKNL